MSHSVAVVMAGSKDQAEILLAPYDETREVDPYDTECGCVETDRQDHASEFVNEKTGITWAKAQQEFNVRMSNMNDVNERERLYQEQVYKPRMEIEKEFLKTYTAKTKPDCINCNGTGFYKTNYNPVSRWDWWIPMSEDYAKKRWGEYKLPMKPEDIGEHSWIPLVIVAPFYGWQENGELGWWGIMTNEKDKDEWSNLYWKIFNESIASKLTPFPIDYHI
jgi:hypothetical protein